MNGPLKERHLGGARAIILHRPHTVVAAITRQLTAIGLTVENTWPDLSANTMRADFIFYDADMGYDEQFPWPAGFSPMPLIALIGSEAPGRIEWSLKIGTHAQLRKPIGDNGVYAALQTARKLFEKERSLRAEIADLRNRLNERQTVVQAVLILVMAGHSEDDAYNTLRRMAMDARQTVEETATALVAKPRSQKITDLCQSKARHEL